LEFIREQNDLKLFEQSLDFCNLNYELNTPNRNYTLFACTDDILDLITSVCHDSIQPTVVIGNKIDSTSNINHYK
jgi:hypothetical protein